MCGGGCNGRGFFRLLEPLFYTNEVLLVGGDFNVEVEFEGGGVGVGQYDVKSRPG